MLGQTRRQGRRHVQDILAAGDGLGPACVLFEIGGKERQTIARLGAMVGAQLDVRRFRPNILVEATEEGAFAEDAWVGCVLRVGGLRLRVDKRDGRCVVLTIDPVTTERNPAILRAIAQDRQGCLGVYGSTAEPGRIAVGDRVIIDSP